jgi:hypothetical protein
MLFGKKPFGQGLSPDAILMQGTIRNAGPVEIPPTPAVSVECQSFLRRCLAPRMDDRPHPADIFDEPWLAIGTAGGKKKLFAASSSKSKSS